jgi:hypothetical protein
MVDDWCERGDGYCRCERALFSFRWDRFGMLLDGQAAFSNRNYVWENVPTWAQGWTIARKGGSINANVTVRAPAPAKALAASDARMTPQTAAEATTESTAAAAAAAEVVLLAGVCEGQSGHDPTVVAGWQPTGTSMTYGHCTTFNNLSGVWCLVYSLG